MAILDWLRTKVANVLVYNTKGLIKPQNHKEFVDDIINVIEEHITDGDIHCGCIDVVSSNTNVVKVGAYFYNKNIINSNFINDSSWRVPSINDINIYFGSNFGKCRSDSLDYWYNSNVRGENLYNLNLRGYGYVYNSFSEYKKSYCMLLSSKSYDGINYDVLRVYYDGSFSLYRHCIVNDVGVSIRLMREFTNEEINIYGGEDDGYIYNNAYTGNDGKKYNAVKVGYSWWLAEDIKETKYSDSTNIFVVINTDLWRRTFINRLIVL